MSEQSAVIFEKLIRGEVTAAEYVNALRDEAGAGLPAMARRHAEERATRRANERSLLGANIALQTRAQTAEARVAELEDALRYIAGYDVAGYSPHLRSSDVAEQVLRKGQNVD